MYTTHLLDSICIFLYLVSLAYLLATGKDPGAAATASKIQVKLSISESRLLASLYEHLSQSLIFHLSTPSFS